MPQDFAIAEGVPSLPKKVAKKITVEPPVFFFGLAFGMIIFANTQLTSQRICTQVRKLIITSISRLVGTLVNRDSRFIWTLLSSPKVSQLSGLLLHTRQHLHNANF